MTKQIKGAIQVERYAEAQGVNLTRSVNENVFDENGNLIFDGYSKEEFSKILSVLPMTHFGSFNFLPAGVYGSFEGASEVIAYRYRKVHLEDSGTLTVLRPGTNGAKRGVYYSILDNAVSTVSLEGSISTNKEYRPGYFGSTYVAQSVYASDSKVVSGMAFNASKQQYVYISWMGGTLNDTQHVGSVIPVASILPNGGSVVFVMTGNTEIFFFVNVSGSSDITLEVRSVPISQVRASATSLTVTQYTNWTVNGFYNTTTTSTHLTMITLNQSNDASKKPYMLIPASTTSSQPYMGGPDVFAAQNSTGTIRLRVVGDAWCTSLTKNIRPKHSYSFLLNPGTKVATLEAGNVAPLTISDPGDPAPFTVSGSLYTTDPITTYDGKRGNFINSYLYLDNGVTFCVFSQNQGSSLVVRAVYPNATSVYDTLEVRKHTSTGFLTAYMQPKYGSPVGSLLCGMEWLPGNKYKIVSQAPGWNTSLNEYKPGATYQFDSVAYGSVYGFEPTTNRKIISDNSRFFISTITGSNVVSNGGVFIEDFKLTSGLAYDTNANGTGSMSISNTLLTNLKNSQLSGVSTVDKNNKTNITLYVPQQSDIPAFALITGVTPSRTNYVRVVEVNVNTRTGTITTLTFKRLVHESSNTFGNLAPDATYGVQNVGVGLTIYDAGTFYFIGGADPYIWKTIGDSNAITFRAKVTKSTAQMDSFVPASTYQNHVPSSGFLPFAAPGVGFGYISFGANWAEDTLRMYFQPVGTTLTEYNNWTDKGSKILLASQDVAKGFIIYFTEEIPVLLSGKSFTMPVQNIDLTQVKANPANTTFHIYIVMKEGLAQYYATEEVIAETGTTAFNNFWIGTVVTNANQIEKININKRSRLDVFGASLEAAGSSFPVSYGLPSGSGIINW